MVTRCLALRKVPIGQLSAGDLRVLLGQSIGTEHLLPLALELLTKNALLEGDYYPGDLLSSAMGTESAYWSNHKPEWKRLHGIAAAVRSELMANDEALRSHRQLLKDIYAFLSSSDA